ncbi:MAG: MBL fold metallo-hydrolase [Thermacetogeniaceae bacterium]
MEHVKVKVTVLCENTVGMAAGLLGEWGLALLLEIGERKILFDTGEQGSVISNAAALGVDLGTVDLLVMSHGHYDHAGGMRAFLRRRGRLPVYLHPDFFLNRYSSRPSRRYIGVPYRPEELTSLGADFVFSREPLEILPGVWFSGEVPRLTSFEKGDDALFYSEEGRDVPDPVRDDASLYCLTPEGILVVTGCAHAGIVNIVEHARRVTGVDRVYGIIGGTHLGPVSKAQQDATLGYLRGLDLKFLAANHCTGLPMIARMSLAFGDVFHFAPAGAAFSLPLAMTP